MQTTYLLECEAMQPGTSLQTFRKNVLLFARLLGFLGPESGGNMFLRNFGKLLRRQIVEDGNLFYLFINRFYSDAVSS